MPKLILVRGVSGAGKSTVAGMFKAVRIAADDFWGEDYNFDASRLHEAHEWCQETTELLLITGQDVVVHNTATTEKEVKVYKDIAEYYNAEFFSIIVENRHGNDSIHNVSQEVRAKQESKLRNSIKLK